MSDHLPYSAEWFLAPQKRFKETILFVPFFGGHKAALKRHIEFVNRIGFDCMAFNLKDTTKTVMHSLVSSDGRIGLKHVWTDQVERLLGEIPGAKIIFAFSNPSASAIEAIVNRNAIDIKGLICDSGPSGNFMAALLNYYKFEKPLKTFPLRAIASVLTSLAWEPDFLHTIEKDMKQLPKGFRILSIRGWKDKLISAENIDKVFEPHHQIEWQKLGLPKAGHLNGLKDFPEEYEPAVEKFLTDIATSC